MAPKSGVCPRADGRVAAERASGQSPGLREVCAVWLLVALSAVAVLETYWRLPASELWKVTGTGPAGGASGAFVFLGYSPTLASIAVLAIVVDRLDDQRAAALGMLALILCATVAIPGVQDPNDLDAKWSNLPAFLGVLIAFGLTVWAGACGRREAVQTRIAGDVARLATGAVALFFAAPYIA